MGKPYESEIRALPDSYSWALSADTSSYSKALQRIIDRPLLTVGSGGSLTAAHIIADLHERYTGEIAKAVTPLGIVGADRRLDRTGVLFVSAGGSNPDVVDAFKLVAKQEPHAILVLSGREESILARTTKNQRGAEFIGMSMPAGKDGYLATNSLLVFSVLTWRAYAQIFGSVNAAPQSLAELIGAEIDHYRMRLRETLLPIWEKPSLVMLHGAETGAAGVDIESRFVEAALGYVNVSDFRNFGHGRHQWLARHSEDVAVLTLETKRDSALGTSTTGLLPARIPIARISILGERAHAAISGVVNVILIAAEAGKARGIDPGRPKVPSFGRRLYHLHGLRAAAVQAGAAGASSIDRNWASERKRRVVSAGVAAEARSEAPDAKPMDWGERVKAVALTIAKATYGGVVFDYDGTLCDAADRYLGLSAEVIGGLLGVIEHGIPVGIATGRGRSVHAALRSVVPSAHWSHILIGYYNGAETRSLDAEPPTGGGAIKNRALTAAYLALKADERIQAHASISARGTQITLELNVGARESALWDAVGEVVAGTAARIGIVRSSHSIDLLAPNVTKLSVVTAVSEQASGNEVLRIGDRGRYPGNDYELLATPHGLSVDEVSGAPDSCWNLAPPGVTGVAATAYYLSTFRYKRRTFRMFGL